MDGKKRSRIILSAEIREMSCGRMVNRKVVSGKSRYVIRNGVLIRVDGAEKPKGPKR